MHGELLEIIFNFLYELFAIDGYYGDFTLWDYQEIVGGSFTQSLANNTSFWVVLNQKTSDMNDLGIGVGEGMPIFISFLLTYIIAFILFVLLIKLFKWLFNLIFKLFRLN